MPERDLTRHPCRICLCPRGKLPLRQHGKCRGFAEISTAFCGSAIPPGGKKQDCRCSLAGFAVCSDVRANLLFVRADLSCTSVGLSLYPGGFTAMPERDWRYNAGCLTQGGNPRYHMALPLYTVGFTPTPGQENVKLPLYPGGFTAISERDLTRHPCRICLCPRGKLPLRQHGKCRGFTEIFTAFCGSAIPPGGKKWDCRCSLAGFVSAPRGGLPLRQHRDFRGAQA